MSEIEKTKSEIRSTEEKKALEEKLKNLKKELKEEEARQDFYDRKLARAEGEEDDEEIARWEDRSEENLTKIGVLRTRIRKYEEELSGL
jgi:chromosome segregation ATPase